MQCGLLGERLGHSYSPQIHSFLGNYQYRLYEKQPQEVESFLKESGLTGFNVTIPYKKAILPYLDDLSPIARKLGAVNTAVRSPDGAWIGHNSDYYGFLSMVKRSGVSVSGKKALVLGSGGASNTAVAVLQELGATVVVLSRSGPNRYDNLDPHSDTRIIVNTTPVGMYPETGHSPISLDPFPELECVLDVIYNPARTKLLLDAERRGLITMNGLWMLVAQAKESAEWFTGRKIPHEKIGTIYKHLRKSMENLILVGMPGSGKSTVGLELSKQMNLEFVDADRMVEKNCGMDIPTIFATYGQDYFRQQETQVLSQLGKRSGLCIATGGGCVTREENYPHLHQNGTIIHLERSVDQLATCGRPLSQTTNLSQMHAQRHPLYCRFADITVENSGSVTSTVQKIITKLEEIP